jgi:hypothetical protein
MPGVRYSLRAWTATTIAEVRPPMLTDNPLAGSILLAVGLPDAEIRLVGPT